MLRRSAIMPITGKISVAAKPFLRKMCAGEVGKLLNPSYADPDDSRPILDFEAPSCVTRSSISAWTH